MAKNGSKVGLWIAVAVLALLLFGSFITNIGLTAVLFSGSSTAVHDRPVDAEPVFDEIWSYGSYNGTKVVRIDLTGIIMRGRRERMFGSEPDMVKNILDQIRAATIDTEVEAILLEVDSPGGGVTPSDEIYTALQNFKAVSEDRWIVVFIRDLGASGAYYAAMAGDYIVAEPTAIVGSVGVLMQTINMKGLGELIGISSVTIASGKNKDMLNPLEPVNPEHMTLLQDLVDRMQDRFASIVMESRGLESRELLDGRVFTADQALEYNLIDRVGYLEDAMDDLASLMEVDDLYIVRYAETLGFFDALFSSRLPQVPDFNAIQSPRFLYLWKP